MVSHIRDSIVTKITFLVMGATSLVLGGVVAYSYISSRNIILAEAEQTARNLTLSVARRIEQEFRSVAKVPEGLATYLEVNPCEKEQALLDLVRASVEKNPEVFGGGAIFEPYAFLKDRKAYAPYYYMEQGSSKFVQLASTTYNYFQKDYYHLTKLLNRPFWSNPHFDEGGGNILMVTYSVPLYFPGTKKMASDFRGVITADISLEWLNQLVRSVQVGKTGFCFIMSDTGSFVSHPDQEFIMKESVFSLAEERNQPGLRAVGRRIIRDKSGFEDIGTSYTGVNSFLAYARIPSTGWVLGEVLPKKELLADLYQLHQKTIALSLTGIILLLLASFFLAKSISRPLLKMSDAAKLIAKGELEIDLSDIHSTDEVGQLAVSFEEMVEGLKQKEFIRDTFGRYLTKEVVQQLLESEDGLELGGEQRELSLMMSDLRGFTALTATIPPDQIISFLNRYLGKMVEVLMDYQGIIDEIIGDGILSFFGAPEPLKDHPARAVACALKMQMAMDEINALNEKDGYAYLQMGIAVHTGNVVVGNIGSEKRSKYGVVGSEVNFTGRIEGYTVGGQVLISQDTYDRVKALVKVKESLVVQMKGIAGDVTLYDIKGMKSPYNIDLPDRDENPKSLKTDVKVEVHRLHKKVVDRKGIMAKVTHKSQTSVKILFDVEIGQWEDIKIVLSAIGTSFKGGESYGKVIKVALLDDKCEATVRMTSMSPEVYRIFKNEIED
ncbi:MAG: HAMP domain-containing protein [Desulfobacteraceae bacterium]|nr:HAMP domain-containing protein [Desulfobacteraceae bacterium]